jgi:hypothetical protein
VNYLTKCALLAGSAALTTGTASLADPGYRQAPEPIASLYSASACAYVRTATTDGKGYAYNSADEDDTIFEIPIVSHVRIKLKKEFLPAEFFIGD